MKTKKIFPKLTLLITFIFTLSHVSHAETATGIQVVEPSQSAQSHLKPFRVTRTAMEDEPTVFSPPLSKSKKEWVVDQKATRGQLNIISGNSHVVKFGRDIKRLAISNPEVADVILLEADELLINTKVAGAANMILWDTNDEIFIYNLTVTVDPTPLESALQSITTEGGAIKVFPTDNGFVVTGNVETVDAQNQIAEATTAFSEDSVSIVRVNDAKQILLQIRFIEIERRTGVEFGLDTVLNTRRAVTSFLPGGTDLSVLPGSDGLTVGNEIDFVPGATVGVPIGAVPDDGSNELFSLLYQTDSHLVNTIIDAIEDKSYGKILARPNLLVRDGEEGNFLVGGEFPVPIQTNNDIEVQYREFGTRLIYRPQILAHNVIRLTLETEVSQLDFANGVTLNNFQIPALTARRTSSVVELESGKSLIMSGLIQQRRTDSESGAPWLRKIPIFGRLFERTDNEFTDTELLIIVTPHLIDKSKYIKNLDQLKIGDPLLQATQLDDPPFEDPQALAIEALLINHTKDLYGENVTPDPRRLKRERLRSLTITRNKKEINRELEEFYKLADEVLNNGEKVFSET